MYILRPTRYNRIMTNTQARAIQIINDTPDISWEAKFAAINAVLSSES